MEHAQPNQSAWLTNIVLQRNQTAALTDDITICHVDNGHRSNVKHVTLTIENASGVKPIVSNDLTLPRGLLTLTVADGEKILIGDDIAVTLTAAYGRDHRIVSGVRLGIKAPRHIKIIRDELKPAH